MLDSITKLITTVFLFTVSSAAFAHTGHVVSDFTAGWGHPFFGSDHLLATLAVGLWAAQSGGCRMWLLPATFMAMLVAGAGLSMQWPHPLLLIETGIAFSVLALGLLTALSLKLPIAPSMGIAALSGLLHGYAHGLELPGSAAPLAYALGFLAATVVLHLGGIAAGAASRRRYTVLAKIAGGIVAMSGIGLLTLS